MRTHHKLTLEERELLYGLQKQGLSIRSIAKKLGRSHSTISRELERNKRLDNIYLPCFANIQAGFRANKQRKKARLKNPIVYDYVREHLRLGWSPEAIAGRLPIDIPGESICHETIYAYIYKHGVLKQHLWRYLVCQRRKRGKIDGRKLQRHSKIPEAISIEKRPQEVALRSVPGHWETDLIIGQARDKGALSVTVERVTRITIISKLPMRTAPFKATNLIKRLSPYPPFMLKTMTTDNGGENYLHQKVTQQLNIDYYFAHAYASWEKGTVENTNQRIRRYIHKGESIDELSHKAVEKLEDYLNSTPRKCLNFKTPNEKMREVLIAGV
jgi:IS30 family transposase